MALFNDVLMANLETLRERVANLAVGLDAEREVQEILEGIVECVIAMASRT